MHIRNLGYPLPYKSEAKNHFFRRFRNLTAYIFGMKHDIHTRVSALRCKLQRVSYISQNDMNFGPQTASNWTEFSPILRKFCIPLHFTARLRGRESANGTQPNFAKRWTVICANNLP